MDWDTYDFTPEFSAWVKLGKPKTFVTWWSDKWNIKTKNLPHSIFKFLISRTNENDI